MTDKEGDKTAGTIVVECELREPPEKVWRALTVPELLAAWMMPNDMTPEVGSRFAFDKGAEAAPIECEVLDADPGKFLRYSWREQAEPGSSASDIGMESTVTFELSRTVSGGTHLRIVHGGFAAAALPAVAMTGAACRLSLRGRAATDWPVAANAHRLCLRAA